MIEMRFPDCALMAEFGDILLSNVNEYVYVTIKNGGNILVTEKYTADSSGSVCISGIGSIAQTVFEKKEFLKDGIVGKTVSLQVSIQEKNNTNLLSKNVVFYPSFLDFDSSIPNSSIPLIPLSRSTEKTILPENNEFISFYGGGMAIIYGVYKSLSGRPVGVYVDYSYLSESNSIYTLDVSPQTISNKLGCKLSDLIYFNVYKNKSAMIKYIIDDRSQLPGVTFVFRNSFGAQESVTLFPSSTARKWTRETGRINKRNIQVSSDMSINRTVESDYITGSETGIIEDLLDSQQICIYDGNSFAPIMIVEEKFEIPDRCDELSKAEITYRYCDRKTKYTPLAKPGIFTIEFDGTFN